MIRILLLAWLPLAISASSAGALTIRLSGIIQSSDEPALIGSPFEGVARFDPAANLMFVGDTRRFFVFPVGGTLSLDVAGFSALGPLAFSPSDGKVSFGVTPPLRPQPPILSGSFLIEGLAGPIDLRPLGAFAAALQDGCCRAALQLVLTGAMGGVAHGAVTQITVAGEPAVAWLTMTWLFAAGIGRSPRSLPPKGRAGRTGDCNP